ncbi:MAG TPA: hypothetical protein VK883_09635 [Arthrobacter sp.]|nr:hypothetical protein [Arthrobacter sp.]
MLVIESRVDVAGLTGRDVTDFMVYCTDERYRRWWPGTHLQLHVLGRATGGVGDVVVMDEFIGRRRLRLRGVVEAVEPGRRLVWRFRKLVPLPARLSLELSAVPGGVSVRHTITAGWPGIGRALDPLLRLYFTPRFTADLDAHVRTEFPLLRDYLRPGSTSRTDN